MHPNTSLYTNLLEKMEIKYPFTEEQKAQLAECYHNTNSKELAERFNCSLRFDNPIENVKGKLSLWDYDTIICETCNQPLKPSCCE